MLPFAVVVVNPSRIVSEIDLQGEISMICPACGAENPASGKFCDNCGAPLEQHKICPSCGAKNEQKGRFCDQCGAKLDQVNVCPKCGVENNQDARFCDVCGTPLNSEILAVSPTSTEAKYERQCEISASVANVNLEVPQESPVTPRQSEEPTGQISTKTTELPDEKSPWGWVTLLVVSVIGGWPACAILAGINWRRMDIPGRMWPTIIGPSALYVWWLFGPETGFFSEYYSGIIISVIFAIVIWFLQRDSYFNWRQKHPIAKRAGWQIPLVILLTFIIFQVIIFIILFTLILL